MKTVAVLLRDDILNNKEIYCISKNLFLNLKDKVKVKLIIHDNYNNFDELINDIYSCDGLILPGGDDIYDIELKIVSYLYEKNFPILGICLGMQTMAVSINGKMATLNTLEHKKEDKYVHEIKINKDSKLYEILKKDKIMVNSRHKDYIINTDLLIGAISDDNVIEEVEDKSKKFFIGLQWHPEDLFDENANKIFNAFIASL